jgi:hypothetical protein
LAAKPPASPRTSPAWPQADPLFQVAVIGQAMPGIVQIKQTRKDIFMKLSTLMLSAVVALGSVASANVLAQTKELKPGVVRNIVLVHGAFVDGSGWKPVYEILRNDGYTAPLFRNH